MLRLVVKNGDMIKIGDDIIIKSMTDGRVSLGIDAPRDLNIERMEAKKPEPKKALNIIKTSSDDLKKYIIITEGK